MSTQIHINEATEYRISDRELVKQIHARTPLSHGAAQRLLSATARYHKGPGIFSSQSSLERKVQDKCYVLANALKEEGYIQPYSNESISSARIMEFMSEISNAYPNWQNEYRTLNKLIPLFF